MSLAVFGRHYETHAHTQTQRVAAAGLKPLAAARPCSATRCERQHSHTHTQNPHTQTTTVDNETDQDDEYDDKLLERLLPRPATHNVMQSNKKAGTTAEEGGHSGSIGKNSSDGSASIHIAQLLPTAHVNINPSKIYGLQNAGGGIGGNKWRWTRRDGSVRTTLRGGSKREVQSERGGLQGSDGGMVEGLGLKRQSCVSAGGFRSSSEGEVTQNEVTRDQIANGFVTSPPLFLGPLLAAALQRGGHTHRQAQRSGVEWRGGGGGGGESSSKREAEEFAVGRGVHSGKESLMKAVERVEAASSVRVVLDCILQSALVEFDLGHEGGDASSPEIN